MKLEKLLVNDKINNNFFSGFFVRFGRKKVVVIGLVVAAIANLIVTVIPNDNENTGEEGCFVSTE